jgi:hypothetical protein
MSTEVAKAGASGGVPAIMSKDWSKFEGDATDILIPKLLVGQATSKFVQEVMAAFGQIVRSTTLEVLGGKGKPFEVIPLSLTKTWILSEKVAGRFEFRGVEPFTAANKDKAWVWSESKDGKTAEWKREQALNFYVLLPRDVLADLAARKSFADTGELPDTEASLLPCLLQFKSTSYKAGKTLVTHFAKAADFGVPPFSNTFMLDTEKVQGDTNSWFIYKVERAGKTEPKFLEACNKWRDIVKTSNVKIDDSDLTGSADTVDVPAGDMASAEGIF